MDVKSRHHTVSIASSKSWMTCKFMFMTHIKHRFHFEFQGHYELKQVHTTHFLAGQCLDQDVDIHICQLWCSCHGKYTTPTFSHGIFYLHLTLWSQNNLLCNIWFCNVILDIKHVHFQNGIIGNPQLLHVSSLSISKYPWNGVQYAWHTLLKTRFIWPCQVWF